MGPFVCTFLTAKKPELKWKEPMLFPEDEMLHFTVEQPPLVVGFEMIDHKHVLEGRGLQPLFLEAVC